MIVTKLLATEKKKITKKQAYVKPKHKTYRELLGLDKPKKQIKVESDNENDDFLEKLLKEERSKKKKKVGMKKFKVIAVHKQNDVQDGGTKQNQYQHRHGSAQQNQNENTKQEAKEEGPNFEEEIDVIKLWKRVESARAKRNSSLSSIASKTKAQAGSESLKIKIDESDSVSYVANNGLVARNNRNRSEKGLTILRSQLKVEPSSTAVLRLSHKVNPQSQGIAHEFEEVEKYPKIEAKKLSMKCLLSMSESRTMVAGISSSLNKTNREKLFKSEMEQNRFLESIRKFKKAKNTFPSLLDYEL